MSPARRLNDRHPFEIYILLWAFLSSLPAAIGIVEPPGSVARQLPGIAARVWIVGLTVGAGVALLGLSWKRPRFPTVTVTGLLLEQVGLTIVGFSTVFYAVAAVSFSGSQAFVAAGVVGAFGMASFAQAVKIQKVLSTSKAPR